MMNALTHLIPHGLRGLRLAAAGGAAIDEDLSKVIRLEGATVLIARSYLHAPAVRGFIARTERVTGQKLVLKAVDMSELAGTTVCQNGGGGGDTLSDSKMMEEAKRLFTLALQKRASDVHILVETLTVITFRIHNDIREVEKHPAEYGQRLCSATYQAMANVSASMFNTREYQDAQISDRSRIPAGLDGIRIATAPTAAGYEMSLRLLYNDAADNHSLESLGFTQPQDNAMRFLRRLPHGINLIGGPTGSGKSTTLQRNLRLLDGECDHTKRILTVEDPPEYTIAGAIQTPVTNAETEEERGVKFRAAIRSALRRDPDVLMIGEIRDYASADLAFQASMTGHQVWSTLHVNGVFSALDRLENLGIAPAILYDPSIVTGLVSQRLLKRLCDHCKEPFARVKERYSGAEQERILRATKVRDLYVRGTGCPHCNQEGTTGRIAVAEIVVTDHKLMSYLRAGDKMGAIDYWRREQGGLTTLENAIFRINAGEVDPLDAESQLGPLTMTEMLKDHRIEQTEVDRAGSS